MTIDTTLRNTLRDKLLQRRTVMVEYAVMLACAGLAWQMKSANTRTQWVMLCALAGGYILAAAAIHRRERIGDADFKT